MISNKQLLKIISNETKDAICEMDVVTPQIFSDYFTKSASQHNEVLNEDELVLGYINEKMTQLTDLNNQTSNNAVKLSHHTSKAIDAIQDKDETALNFILKETLELRKEIDKLKESLYKDELTSVYNRKWLHDHCLQGEPPSFMGEGSLALIDLNYFKQINDQLGHVIGDKVLIFLANQLRKTGGNVIRYGGDEFVVLFKCSKKEKSEPELLSSIRKTMLKKHMQAKGASFKVSFSFGFAHFEAGDELEKVIEIADQNMYEDKKQIKKKIKGIEV